ncbi:DUF6152 family protein [Roseicella aerolata]|uniref:Uncharacterized protein n=1 Tax=Roseicella aerolata TaxID=2883479 RepID=A0A9X1ICL9_9PROT|nr:DUF6152 family protein [Roseicella aerolata]MCB4821942.1 hypothetical protein [Roseicella aerolata]
MTRRFALAGILFLAIAPAALAHHGWSSFDREKVLDLTAPVIRSTYANPHGLLLLARDGVELTIELAPTSRLQARGLAPEDIAPGRVVRVHAYESTGNPRLFRAEWIEVEGRRIELR